MIDVKNLTFAYGSQPPVFRDFSWQANRGEAWAIIGPSGCGKTTLLYLLAGLRHPTEGQVLIADQPITRPRPQTGLILQNHGLLPWATVEKNARLGLTVRRFYGPDGRHAPREDRLNQSEIARRAGYWLERLGIDAQRDKFPAQLSGGQQQRTAIARTLAMQPDLLLMDEPFSALDAYTREDLQNLTQELRREAHLTTVIVTHNIEEAAFLGKRILVLADPPNVEARIVENPDAGGVDYRSHAAYAARCDELRGLMRVRA